MTRVIAGSARGVRLKVPARGTRPTADRVREAMFSRLGHLDALREARVLDLYAGSGALGIEALSRGAHSAVFVERSAQAAKVCRENLAAAGFQGQVHVAAVAAFLTGSAPASPFHTVLADPPYDASDSAKILDLLMSGWLAPEAVIMWEQPSKAAPLAWPEGLRDLGAKVYGEARLNFAEVVDG